MANDYIAERLESYLAYKRTGPQGPLRIGRGLNLQTDVYSCAFVYQLKRAWLEDELSEKEEDETEAGEKDEKSSEIAHVDNQGDGEQDGEVS